MPIIEEKSKVLKSTEIEPDPGLEYFQAQRTFGELSFPDLQRVNRFFANATWVQQSHRPYKSYRNAKKIPLRPKLEAMNKSWLELLTKRETRRSFGTRKLSFEEISNVLLAAYGEQRSMDPRKETSPRYQSRGVPSGGALFPLEIYFVAIHVEGLDPGLYHFNVRDNALELLSEGVPVSDLQEAYRDKSLTENLGKVGGLIVMSAMFQRTVKKYGRRGWKFVMLDAGHVNQNIYLASAAQDLSYWPQGGVNEAILLPYLGIDGLHEGIVLTGFIGSSET